MLMSRFSMPGPWNFRGAQVPKVPVVGREKAAGFRKKPGAVAPASCVGSGVAPANGSPMQLARLAWLPPVALASGAVHVKGRPLFSVATPLSWHPPIIRLAIDVLFRIKPPFPLRRTYN